MIVDQAAAQRLARSLFSDVALYNRSKLAGGADARSVLAAEFDEARALFCQRVAPELHPVFERELNAFNFKAPPRSSTHLLVALVVGLAVVTISVLVATR